MQKVSEFVNKLASYVVMTAVLVMTLVIVLQVICRYFLGFSFFWAEELARYLLIWITFLGGSVAFRKAQLASIDILVERLPGLLKVTVVIISQVIVLGFLVTAAVYGFKQSFSPAVITQVSPALRLPMMYNYLAVPISFSIMCLHCLGNVFQNISTAMNGGGKA
ncbi:TRAP transporter small permease [Desulfotomaculum defluvii]